MYCKIHFDLRSIESSFKNKELFLEHVYKKGITEYKKLTPEEIKEIKIRIKKQLKKEYRKQLIVTITSTIIFTAGVGFIFWKYVF